MVAKLANLVAVEVNWIACVWGLANGYPWLGCVSVLASVVLHLSLEEQRLRRLAFIGGMVLFGFGFDSFLGMTGQIQFAQGARWSPPAMVALWANLSTAFPLSLSWLRTRLALSAALGLLGGMAAYAGGAKLNAISIPDPVAWHLAVIGALWAIVLPSALWIHLRLFPVVAATQSTPTGDI